MIIHGNVLMILSRVLEKHEAGRVRLAIDNNISFNGKTLSIELTLLCIHTNPSSLSRILSPFGFLPHHLSIVHGPGYVGTGQLPLVLQIRVEHVQEQVLLVWDGLAGSQLGKTTLRCFWLLGALDEQVVQQWHSRCLQRVDPMTQLGFDHRLQPFKCARVLAHDQTFRVLPVQVKHVRHGRARDGVRVRAQVAHVFHVADQLRVLDAAQGQTPVVGAAFDGGVVPAPVAQVGAVVDHPLSLALVHVLIALTATTVRYV